jgi:hypothetical protein
MSKTITGTGSKSIVDASNTASRSNAGDQMLQEAIRDASSRVTEALMDLAYPVKVLKVGSNSITVNLPQESTEIDARYSVWSLGEELLDPDTGESLGADEEYVGDVVITVVKPKFSNAVPVGDLTLEEIGEGMVLRRVSEAQIKKEATAEKAKQKEAFKSRF